MSRKAPVFAAALCVLITILACSTSPAATQAPVEVAPPASDVPVAVVNADKPGDAPGGGDVYYDTESKSTSSLGYAPYGEIYKLNRFERPFTKDDRAYLGAVDIKKFRMNKDTEWDFAVITMIGQIPTDASAPDYGVEIDLDLDGRGDVLLWAKAPYSTDWTNSNLQVFEDPNNDVGGTSPVDADPPPGGNGYEKVILDDGKGDDAGLAWVRLDPQDGTVIQFAFKRTLAAQVKGFLWNAWADAGLRDVTKFNYNDHFTKADAGSALKNDAEFPPKQLFAMDNTCRLSFGFAPTGYEPLLCPPIVQPTETSAPPQPTKFIPGILNP